MHEVNRVDNVLLIMQVAELHDLIAKWDPTCSSLPSIVERLTLLKDLHEQGRLQLDCPIAPLTRLIAPPTLLIAPPTITLTTACRTGTN